MAPRFLGARTTDASVNEADAALVERLRALEQAAWTELYDAHHAALWRYAYARTGDRHAAEDVAAQAFVEALQSIGRYRYRGKPVLAWLYAIARNLASKHVRERGRGASHAATAAEPAENPLDQRLGALVLADALAKLTRDQRDAIILRYYAGCTTAEVARLLGKREVAVYSLETRALRALRRHLGDEFQRFSREADENPAARGIDT